MSVTTDQVKKEEPPPIPIDTKKRKLRKKIESFAFEGSGAANLTENGNANAADAIVAVNEKVAIVKKISKNKNKVSVVDLEELAKNCVPPHDFETIWEKMLFMRRDRTAPVDIWGTHTDAESGEPPTPEVAKIKRFQRLTSAFLSSRTNDYCTAACMERLKEYGLTVDHVLETPEPKLAELIKPVGFYNVKAKNLLKICSTLKEDYDGDVPETYEQLLELPGIGPKMALIILHSAWNRVEGIAVDIHVHRVCNRLKWVETKTPEETCLALAQRIPKPLWAELNRVVVGFGQQVCRPVSPLCDVCLLNEFCPSASKKPDPEKTEQNWKYLELAAPNPPPLAIKEGA